MECEDTIKLLPAYLDNEVIPITQIQIEEHLSHCLKCREELNYIASIQAKIRQTFKQSTSNIVPPFYSWAKLSNLLETSKTRKDNSFLNIFNEWLSWHAWQTMTITAVVVLLAVGFLFGLVILPSIERGVASNTSASLALGQTNSAPAIGMLPPMTIQINTNPDSAYQYGTNVEINVSLTNLNSEARVVDQFPPQISIYEVSSTKNVGIAQVIRSFPAGNPELTMQSQETENYNFSWDQKDSSGKQVSPGWYAINVELNSHSVSDNSTSDQIQGTAGRIYIMPPEGVIQKTIEINKPVTVNGFTVMLEKIELSDTGAKVYIITPPESNSLPQSQGGGATAPQGTNTPSSIPSLQGISTGSGSTAPQGTNNSSIAVAPPPIMPPSFAEAEYSIDGGPFVQAGMTMANTLTDNTLERIWNLDPVSKNAKELTFRINSINSIQEPWEFEIPLN